MNLCRARTAAIAAVFIVSHVTWAAEPPPRLADDLRAADKQAQDKKVLTPLQVYIGSWRGVGQVRRGSNQGAWTEQSDWAWKFSDDGAAIVFAAPDSKHYSSGRITPTGKADRFELAMSRADGNGEDSFTGRLKDGQLVFDTKDAATTDAARVTLRTVADGDRLVIRLERRAMNADAYSQIAEIGYTRQGSDFAKGASGPECVVTGGAGTIAVQYEGKTYYVCCSGCRDLFNEDPAAILAEYRERKAQR